jgi:hypothetical protein
MGALDGKVAVATAGGSTLGVQVHQLEAGMFEAIKWPEEMAPSRSPIHFTNELEVAASPEMIWSLPLDPKGWPSFYPGVYRAGKCWYETPGVHHLIGRNASDTEFAKPLAVFIADTGNNGLTTPDQAGGSR